MKRNNPWNHYLQTDWGEFQRNVNCLSPNGILWPWYYADQLLSEQVNLVLSTKSIM